MYETSSKPVSRTWIQPLDRVAMTLMAVLSLVIVGMLWGGHQSKPKVRDFSWQGQTVGADDTAFVLTFSRPMDHASVENSLQIGPPLPGQISWSGRRMVYTLNEPAPYGSQFQIALQNAREQFTGSGRLGEVVEPFSGQFYTRDRSFVYIGIGGEDDGRLVLYNLTRQKKTALSPAYLVVQNFQIDPTGQTISFLASDRALSADEQISGQKLYQISTNSLTATNSAAAGSGGSPPPSESLPREILNNRDYINQKFQLSPDGKFLIVQRVKRNNPSEVGLWRVQPGGAPELLSSDAGGEFRITADGQSLAIAQGEGLSLIPLTATSVLPSPQSSTPASTPASTPLASTPPASTPQSSTLPPSTPQTNTSPLSTSPASSSQSETQFLAKFAKVLDFSRDGRLAAAIKFNPSEYTRSLFILDSQRGEKEYFKTKGSILQAHFSPTGRYLYCLLTELVPGPTYREQPYFAVVDLQVARLQPLLLLPEQRDMTVNLSPDGLALIFDQLVLAPPASPIPPANTAQRVVEGRLLQTSYQWLLPLTTTPTGEIKATTPQRLPLLGLQPQWMP